METFLPDIFYWFAAVFLLSVFGWGMWFIFPIWWFQRNPSLLRLGYREPEQSRTFRRPTPQIETWVEQFKALGFGSLGIKTEKMPLWGPELEEYAFASPEANAFAAIVHFQYPSYAGFYLYTLFTNGAIVLTSTNPHLTEGEQPAYSVRRVPGAAPSEALAVHAVRVRQFQERGLTVFPGYSRAARLEATRRFYAAPDVRAGMKAPSPLLFLAAFVLGVLVCLFPLLSRFR